MAVLTGSVGAAFSEDTDFDELDDLGHRAGRDRFGRRVRSAPLSTGRQRAVAVVVALLVVALGTRDLFFGTLPLVGQLAPLPSWSTSWHHFFSGWQSVGVGTTAPASPAFGIVGLSGTVLFGAMGTLQRVLLLGCIPVGAWGVSRFMRPLVSPRARVVAVICYLGLPLPYGALGTGRWDGLVAYAAVPFIALRLARTAGIPPFAVEPGPRWRTRPAGQIAILGALIAASSAFAPAIVPLVVVMALAWFVGSALVGARDRAGRVLVVAAEGVGAALVLAAPWVVGTVVAGKASVQIFGLPISGATAPGWGEVLRFAIGPAARSPIAWLLVVAAALPLVIGRGVRLGWAARLWVTALGSWGLAYAASRGDLGSFTPSESVVLVPAGLAVAAGVGLGISAFENDLTGREFGWRQVISVAALVFVALGLVPVAASAAGGRWDLPSQGVEAPLAFLTRPGTTAVARVLWLGDPRALPAGGWTVEPGLAFALTPEHLPDAAQVFTPAGDGPASLVADAVRLAVSGGTVHLGRLLAPAGVRYVVVVDAVAPSMVGTVTPSVAAPPPAGLEADLLEQGDLQVVPGELGIQVFENGEMIPVTAAARQPAARGAHLVLPRAGGRSGLATRAERAVERCAGDRGGARGHPVRRLCPGGQLRARRERPGRAAASGVRVGGPVRGAPRRGLVVALAVPPRPPRGDARGGGVGAAGRGHPRTIPARESQAGRPRSGGAVSPAHHSSERRWVVLALVVVVVVGVSVAAAARSTPAPAGAPATPSALVSAPDAESSASYCTGQTTSTGSAPGFLILTNTTARPVTGTITAVTDAGDTVHTAVAVPAPRW